MAKIGIDSLPVDPDKMPHQEPADLGLHCLPNTCGQYSGNPLISSLANRKDPDEMQHNPAFHQGLHCL